jgi:cytoskeletal protein CcmA (bactofilin family)
LFKRRKSEDPNSPDGAEPGASTVIPPDAAASEAHPAAKPDSGLGVPPYRPAPPKEALTMGRTPYPAPASPTAPQGMPSQGIAVPNAPPSGLQPGPRPMPGREPSRAPMERRTLVVGRGISVQGTVQDAERLVVEGTVEASMIHAAELSISPGGVFKGEVEVEDAEVAGTIDGTLTARGNLIVRATGKVLGTARCRRLQVEDGGQITGHIEMLTEATAPAPRTTAEATSQA